MLYMCSITKADIKQCSFNKKDWGKRWQEQEYDYVWYSMAHPAKNWTHFGLFFLTNRVT